MKQFLPILSLLLLFSCMRAPDTEIVVGPSVTAEDMMVATSHPLAARVGVAIMEKGGNAVDAAIAVQFALAVVNPRAGNIGGGGFMIVRLADGTTDALDYREKAPKKATRTMFLDSLGNPVPESSRYDVLSVGVPGTVDGLIKAHKKYGKLESLGVLIEPAIALAEEGFNITETEANRLNRFQEAFKKYNDDSIPFVKDTGWKAGDLLVQTKLAATLQRIKEQGRSGFYGGETAQSIVGLMEQRNGLITADDLDAYEAKWRTPIKGNYKNYKIISMPPPSSGGIALMQLLEMIEPYPIAEWGFRDPRAIHLMAEAERRAFADRAKHLGDSDFYEVPIDQLLDSVYINNRMEDYDPEQATVSSSILAGQFEVAKESFETTHTSVVDADGNAVSVTTTLNSNYGSKVMVAEAGFFLNNEMDDFSAKPGVPNQFGLVGAEANSIQPEKRMLSSMTPTIIEKDGELFMVLGAPGGPTIITAVFQVFLNVAEFGMSLEEAITASRFHHQWLPDQIWYERDGFSEQLIDQLSEKGHQFEAKNAIALVKAIQVLPSGQLQGVGDPRNADDCAGGR